MESTHNFIYVKTYYYIVGLPHYAQLAVLKLTEKLLADFRETKAARAKAGEKVSVAEWTTFMQNAIEETKNYALSLTYEAELNSYQQKVISAINCDCEEVNWQRVQSQIQWIGNFSGHQVAYNQILQLPPITDEFEEAILAYNRAVVTLRKEASRQSKLFVDIRKELDTSKKHT